jgi:hypothetical protein
MFVAGGLENTDPPKRGVVLSYRAHAERHPRQLVWIDDEADESLTTERLLVVKTDSELGLTPQHLDTIRAWVA